MNTKPTTRTQMQTHHLNIIEHQPLYSGDVLGGNRGEIWSDLEREREPEGRDGEPKGRDDVEDTEERERIF